VFVPRPSLDRFVQVVLDEWHTMAPTIVANREYTSMVNRANFDRVVGLIDDAVARGAVRYEAVPAGETLPDPASRKIAPTLLTGVTAEMAIDGEEVFGPVLAVHAYDYVSEATDFIAERPHPLTLYWYGPEDAQLEWVLDRTQSGSVNVNDFAVNMMLSDLPFGGVGQSGYGAYHGEVGFTTFTHLRAVASSNMRFSLAGLITPPFGKVGDLMAKAQLAQARRRARKLVR
jgi:coniferyl-aldehyde dehydrogenase